MEKLNELVELAKKATSGKWIADSGEGWDAIISQQDMVNGNFIVGEFIGPDSKPNKDFVLAASPENILAIAEAFRALEQEVQKNLEGALAWQQRAEAAEAKLAELEKQEPVAYTDEEELKVMRQGTYADMFTPHDSYKLDPQWIPLFTRPALTAQPVKLPDNVPCKGAPQFVWLQVSCDTGNPSEWPEHPEAGVTWHTEQIHSDDVLYIRANSDEVQE